MFNLRNASDQQNALVPRDRFPPTRNNNKRTNNSNSYDNSSPIDVSRAIAPTSHGFRNAYGVRMNVELPPFVPIVNPVTGGQLNGYKYEDRMVQRLYQNTQPPLPQRQSRMVPPPPLPKRGSQVPPPLPPRRPITQKTVNEPPKFEGLDDLFGSEYFYNMAGPAPNWQDQFRPQGMPVKNKIFDDVTYVYDFYTVDNTSSENFRQDYDCIFETLIKVAKKTTAYKEQKERIHEELEEVLAIKFNGLDVELFRYIMSNIDDAQSFQYIFMIQQIFEGISDSSFLKSVLMHGFAIAGFRPFIYTAPLDVITQMTNPNTMLNNHGYDIIIGETLTNRYEGRYDYRISDLMIEIRNKMKLHNNYFLSPLLSVYSLNATIPLFTFERRERVTIGEWLRANGMIDNVTLSTSLLPYFISVHNYNHTTVSSYFGFLYDILQDVYIETDLSVPTSICLKIEGVAPVRMTAPSFIGRAIAYSRLYYLIKKGLYRGYCQMKPFITLYESTVCCFLLTSETFPEEVLHLHYIKARTFQLVNSDFEIGSSYNKFFESLFVTLKVYHESGFSIRDSVQFREVALYK